MTIRPNIWMNRRYASQPKRSLPVSAIRPCSVCSLRPRLRTVSIIPGIENLAPERTDTSSGFFASPKPLPDRRSTSRIASRTSSHRPAGSCLAGREVVVAGLGRDRESGRRRQAGDRHLGEARALAAEQVLHAAVAFGRPLAPGVDVALGGLVGSIGTGCGGRGHRDGCSSGSAPLMGGAGNASLQVAIVPAGLVGLRVADRCRAEPIGPRTAPAGARPPAGRAVPSVRRPPPSLPGDPTQR